MRKNNKLLFSVVSSHGKFWVSGNDGKVIAFEPNSGNSETARQLKGIDRFDLDEYQERTGRDIKHGDNIDIVEIGYWHTPYVSPVKRFSNEDRIAQNH